MRFIKIPFASSGDKTAPPATDPAGGINYTQGYPVAYSKDPATDPSAKRIEREYFNGLMNDLSTAINEIQVSGIAPYISSADNGGSPFAYAKGQCVSYGNIVWMCMGDNNQTTPSIANNWQSVGGPLLGVPFPWPNSSLPEFPGAVFMKCNGSTFTAAQYPLYASVNSALKTPELRGEFIRGWDDGRGVDSGRALLSAQGDAIRNITGGFKIAGSEGLIDTVSGAFTVDSTNKPSLASSSLISGTSGAARFNASNVVPTASENRPRNVAFQYIVRVG